MQLKHALMTTLLLTFPLSAEQAHFLTNDEFTGDWKISKQFTIAVARKMPAEFYSFKASPEERSFGEQMAHIAGSLFERFSEISGITPPAGQLPVSLTRESVIDQLNRSFDYVLDVLPRLTDEQLLSRKFRVNFDGRPGPEINGRDMIMNMFVHVAHHRAQCEVYLRLKGITPPEYTF